MGKDEANKKNWVFIIGVLVLCVGMQFANYGTAVCLSAEVTKMDAMQYYVLISAFGTLGMLLILPIVGKLTAILGQRNMIVIGIIIQLVGRILMMFTATWVPYGLAYLLQSIGGGFYISCAYVLMPMAVQAHERAKFFGYIAVANAIGAICGPILISAMYSAGGIVGKLAYIANLPLTIIGFLMVLPHCPNTKTPGASKGFDFLGLILTVVGLTCMVLWMNLGGKMFAWASAISLVLLAVTIICIAWMIRRELSISNPAVPIKMFRNKRLTFAFIGSLVAAAYSTCSGSYCVMWIRMNFSEFPATTLFNGTATTAQQIVILILGFFLGAYIGKKFVKRFRVFGILSMVAAMAATGILYCLKFTGTAAGGDLVVIGPSIPLGMIVIYIATAIGGFTSVVAQSTFSAFWQSNTPREDVPSGAALYNFGATGGSVIFGSVVGVVLGSSNDYTRAFATGFVFATIGLICAIIGFRFSKEEIAAAEQAGA
ncbi:MAG: MFS transporter [Clostridiales bacterium]|nr:MFS transporter [Clostridiales bacterium]